MQTAVLLEVSYRLVVSRGHCKERSQWGRSTRRRVSAFPSAVRVVIGACLSPGEKNHDSAKNLASFFLLAVSSKVEVWIRWNPDFRTRASVLACLDRVSELFVFLKRRAAGNRSRLFSIFQYRGNASVTMDFDRARSLARGARAQISWHKTVDR